MLSRRHIFAAAPAIAVAALAAPAIAAGIPSFEAEFAALVAEVKILDNGSAHGLSDDAWDRRWDRYEARRQAFLDQIEALPETPQNIMPRALAFALLHAVDMGDLEDGNTTDCRLAVGMVRSALALAPGGLN